MARNLLTFRLVENLFCYVCLTFFFMLKSIWCTLHMFYFLLFYFYIQILFVLFLATRLFSLWCNRIGVSIDQRRYGATQISYSQNHQEYIFWDSISVTAIRRNWELMNQCKSSARSKCKIGNNRGWGIRTAVFAFKDDHIKYHPAHEPLQI